MFTILTLRVLYYSVVEKLKVESWKLKVEGWKLKVESWRLKVGALSSIFSNMRVALEVILVQSWYEIIYKKKEVLLESNTSLLNSNWANNNLLFPNSNAFWKLRYGGDQRQFLLLHRQDYLHIWIFQNERLLFRHKACLPHSIFQHQHALFHQQI